VLRCSLLFCTLFWTAVLGVGVAGILMGGFANIASQPWALLAVMVLFEIFLIAGLVWSGMSACNPQFVIEIDGEALIGAELRGKWSTVGGITRMRHVTLVLEGAEETSGTGRTSSRYSSVFARIPLVGPRSHETARGEFAVTLPPDMVPTFGSGVSRVVWYVAAHGEIGAWPAAHDDFEVRIDAYTAPKKITGRLDWSPHECKAEGEIALELVWQIGGRAYPDRGVVDRVELTLLPGQTSVEYTFTVPNLTPFSMQGKYLEVDWFIEVVRAKPGVFGDHRPLLRRKIIISPTGEPLTLAQLPPSPYVLTKRD
jgi:hypothetical protein